MTLFQKEHLLECIEAFEEDVTTPMAPPSQKGLFDVNSDDEILDENRSAVFHSVVQELLYISMISFSSTMDALSYSKTSTCAPISASRGGSNS